MPNNTNPLFLITIIFIAGIIVGYYVNLSDTFFLIVVCFFMLLIILTLIFFNKFTSQALFFILFVSVFFAGWFKITVDNRAAEKNILEKLFEYNGDIILSGIVTEKRPMNKNNKVSCIVDTKVIYINNKPINLETTTLIFLQVDTSNYTYKDIRYGDELFALGKLVEPAGRRNPGEFDYAKYLELNGIYSVLKVKGYESVIVRSSNNGDFIQLKIIEPVRDYIRNILYNNMGRVEAAFLMGLLVGDRTDIPEEVRQDFLNAGVTHVLAISGLHVMFLAMIVSLLFSLFIKNKYLKNSLIIVSLLFYLLLTGGRPSVIRATIMCIIFIVGNCLDRKTLSLNSLSLAALIILVYNSRQLFSSGFQLSFSCVFALIYVYPILSDSFKFKFNRKIGFVLRESLLCSIAVMVILYPLLALLFEKVSFVSIFANIVVIPAVNLSLAIGFLQVLTYSILPSISNLFTELNQSLLWFNLKLIKFFGSMDPLIVNEYGFTVIKLVIYYCFCFLFLHTIKRKKIGLAIAGILLLLNISIYPDIFKDDEKLKITFIDVGQGEATLIRTPNNKNIMVDAGPVSDNFDSGEKIIYPFLLRESVNKINLFFLSHFHDDHFGGLPYLIERKMIDTIYFYDSTGNGSICNYLSTLSFENGTVFKQVDFSNYIIDGLKIIKLNSKSDYNYKSHKNKQDNNLSLVLKMYYGNTSILFTGDLENEVEQVLCKRYGDFLKSDILKVAHHGSLSGTEEDFINYVNPRYAIICAARRNVHKLPSPLIVHRLLSNNSNVNITGYEGAIIFEATNNKFEKMKWK